MLEFRSVTKRFVKQIGIGSLLPFSPKRYVLALENFSFQCRPGEILGILGPNGAGKTTLAKLAMSLVLPDCGKILINGEEVTPKRHELRHHIALITADDRSFFGRLSGRENLKFFLALYGIADTRFAFSLAEALELAEFLDRPFATYSTGMRRKLGIVRGLMVNPDVLLFDEATNGLDPVSVIQLKRIVLEHFFGKTILWTTHRLEEIGWLCTRTLVVKNGRVHFDGAVSQFMQSQDWQARNESATALEQAYLSLVSD